MPTSAFAGCSLGVFASTGHTAIVLHTSAQLSTPRIVTRMAAVAPCIAHLASPPPSSPTLTGRISPRAASRYEQREQEQGRVLVPDKLSYAKNDFFVWKTFGSHPLLSASDRDTIEPCGKSQRVGTVADVPTRLRCSNLLPGGHLVRFSLKPRRAITVWIQVCSVYKLNVITS